MANPIDTSSDSETFIGSREKSNAGYGRNGDPSASSLLPGQKAPPISGNVAPSDATVPGLAGADTLAARLKGGSNSPDHPRMKARTVISDGSPGSLLGSTPARPVKR
jgi:hypothetical protein